MKYTTFILLFRCHPEVDFDMGQREGRYCAQDRPICVLHAGTFCKGTSIHFLTSPLLSYSPPNSPCVKFMNRQVFLECQWKCAETEVEVAVCGDGGGGGCMQKRRRKYAEAENASWYYFISTPSTIYSKLVLIVKE
jgi:hypothetical protein